MITNPGVDFRVGGNRVRMEPGDLCCLDTSYRHSVPNQGCEKRLLADTMLDNAGLKDLLSKKW